MGIFDWGWGTYPGERGKKLLEQYVHIAKAASMKAIQKIYSNGTCNVVHARGSWGLAEWRAHTFAM